MRISYTYAHVNLLCHVGIKDESRRKSLRLMDQKKVFLWEFLGEFLRLELHLLFILHFLAKSEVYWTINDWLLYNLVDFPSEYLRL